MDKAATTEDEEKSIPIYELPFQHLEMDSDEEILLDCDRDEFDGCYKLVMNEHHMTYTRVRLQVKIYYKTREPNNGSVLYDGNYPVPTTTNWLLIIIMLLRPVSQL